MQRASGSTYSPPGPGRGSGGKAAGRGVAQRTAQATPQSPPTARRNAATKVASKDVQADRSPRGKPREVASPGSPASRDSKSAREAKEHLLPFAEEGFFAVISRGSEGGGSGRFQLHSPLTSAVLKAPGFPSKTEPRPGDLSIEVSSEPTAAGSPSSRDARDATEPVRDSRVSSQTISRGTSELNMLKELEQLTANLSRENREIERMKAEVNLSPLDFGNLLEHTERWEGTCPPSGTGSAATVVTIIPTPERQQWAQKDTDSEAVMLTEGVLAASARGHPRTPRQSVDQASVVTVSEDPTSAVQPSASAVPSNSNHTASTKPAWGSDGEQLERLQQLLAEVREQDARIARVEETLRARAGRQSPREVLSSRGTPPGEQAALALGLVRGTPPVSPRNREAGGRPPLAPPASRPRRDSQPSSGSVISHTTTRSNSRRGDSREILERQVSALSSQGDDSTPFEGKLRLEAQMIQKTNMELIQDMQGVLRKFVREERRQNSQRRKEASSSSPSPGGAPATPRRVTSDSLGGWPVSSYVYRSVSPHFAASPPVPGPVSPVGPAVSAPYWLWSSTAGEVASFVDRIAASAVSPVPPLPVTPPLSSRRAPATTPGRVILTTPVQNFRRVSVIQAPYPAQLVQHHVSMPAVSTLTLPPQTWCVQATHGQTISAPPSMVSSILPVTPPLTPRMVVMSQSHPAVASVAPPQAQVLPAPPASLMHLTPRGPSPPPPTQSGSLLWSRSPPAPGRSAVMTSPRLVVPVQQVVRTEIRSVAPPLASYVFTEEVPSSAPLSAMQHRVSVHMTPPSTFRGQLSPPRPTLISSSGVVRQISGPHSIVAPVSAPGHRFLITQQGLAQIPATVPATSADNKDMDELANTLSQDGTEITESGVSHSPVVAG